MVLRASWSKYQPRNPRRNRVWLETRSASTPSFLTELASQSVHSGVGQSPAMGHDSTPSSFGKHGRHIVAAFLEEPTSLEVGCATSWFPSGSSVFCFEPSQGFLHLRTHPVVKKGSTFAGEHATFVELPVSRSGPDLSHASRISSSESLSRASGSSVRRDGKNLRRDPAARSKEQIRASLSRKSAAAKDDCSFFQILLRLRSNSGRIPQS